MPFCCLKLLNCLEQVEYLARATVTKGDCSYKCDIVADLNTGCDLMHRRALKSCSDGDAGMLSPGEGNGGLIDLHIFKARSCKLVGKLLYSLVGISALVILCTVYHAKVLNGDVNRRVVATDALHLHDDLAVLVHLRQVVIV